MADAPRNRFSPLAAIVIALLALLVVIAVVRCDGTTESPDASVTMPVDMPDENVTPDSPNAPAGGGAAPAGPAPAATR